MFEKIFRGRNVRAVEKAITSLNLKVLLNWEASQRVVATYNVL